MQAKQANWALSRTSVTSPTTKPSSNPRTYTKARRRPQWLPQSHCPHQHWQPTNMCDTHLAAWAPGAWHGPRAPTASQPPDASPPGPEPARKAVGTACPTTHDAACMQRTGINMPEASCAAKPRRCPSEAAPPPPAHCTTSTTACEHCQKPVTATHLAEPSATHLGAARTAHHHLARNESLLSNRVDPARRNVLCGQHNAQC